MTTSAGATFFVDLIPCSSGDLTPHWLGPCGVHVPLYVESVRTASGSVKTRQGVDLDVIVCEPFTRREYLARNAFEVSGAWWFSSNSDEGDNFPPPANVTQVFSS